MRRAYRTSETPVTDTERSMRLSCKNSEGERCQEMLRVPRTHTWSVPRRSFQVTPVLVTSVPPAMCCGDCMGAATLRSSKPIHQTLKTRTSTPTLFLALYKERHPDLKTTNQPNILVKCQEPPSDPPSPSSFPHISHVVTA